MGEAEKRGKRNMTARDYGMHVEGSEWKLEIGEDNDDKALRGMYPCYWPRCMRYTRLILLMVFVSAARGAIRPLSDLTLKTIQLAASR